MLRSLHAWQKGSVTTLIPNTGVQFLDFGISAAFAGSVQQRFHCEIVADDGAGPGQAGELLHLVTLDADRNPYCRDPLTGATRAVPEDRVFTVRGDDALDTLAGRWLPAPFLRVREDGTFAEGPSNWVRLFITRLREPDADGNRWRVTLAFDTLLAERPADLRYVMPEPRDAAEMTMFGLATRFTDINPFMREDWVRKWLLEAYLAALSQRSGRKVTQESLTKAGIYWAVYAVILAALGLQEDPDRPADAPEGPIIPRLRFVDETLYMRDRRPIPVNLVLDIGNSRSCGILIEETAEGAQRLDISQAYRLELRDLSNPAQTYADPFESRVEFQAANFNLGGYSKMTRRPIRDAFWWPSPVRVGPEAAWLSTHSDGTLGRSGLSSPKRYIWDRNERMTPWVNNGYGIPDGEKLPAIRGPIPSKLNHRGDLLKPGEVPGMKPAYSRSSVYMLMLTELLTHALIQINAPATRMHQPRRDEPRQLRRIILTVPSATPVAEQKLLKRLARDALHLLWQVMGWDTKHPMRALPELKLDWDEATAIHLVYLYNEIAQKVQTAPNSFFSMLRRNRQQPAEQSMMRIASMDMGGGTTDLMIIQHEVTDGDRAILPRQLFREGFRLAGEDILKQVIESEVLPCLRQALQDAGIARPDHFLAERFGGDREGMTQQQRTLRALFVSQVLRPAALFLLARYEAAGRRATDGVISARLADCFPIDRRPSATVLDYLADAVRRQGVSGFNLEQVLIETRLRHLASTIQGVVRPILTDLCDVVRAYDCDVLLLSGRPSRLPVIKDIITGQCPVPPGRIVSMDAYQVGNWYPFNSPTGTIDDPKTTAAVGAMLCQVCEGQVEGILMRTSELRMHSTARHIGVMELNDQIRTSRLMFTGIDLDQYQAARSQSVIVTPPAFIGYRQLPLERWKTTPLYFLDFRDVRRVGEMQMPLTVALEREPPQDGDESMVEEFQLREAKDAKGRDVTDELRLSFQTLRVERDQEAGYWLDSGVLSVNWQG